MMQQAAGVYRLTHCVNTLFTDVDSYDVFWFVWSVEVVNTRKNR